MDITGYSGRKFSICALYATILAMQMQCVLNFDFEILKVSCFCWAHIDAGISSINPCRVLTKCLLSQEYGQPMQCVYSK